MSKLLSQDKKLVTLALEAGHRLEASLSEIDAESFRQALKNCAAAESDLVKKLSPLADKVKIELGPKHLMGLLVPIERISGRAARDEEFLYFERDRPNFEPEPTRESSEAKKNQSLIVVCENIRSAFNVGSIFRTTEAFGASDVWLTGYTPDPQKTAMGTDAVIQARHFDRSKDAVTEARRLGAKIVGLETSDRATPLEDFEWPKVSALFVGNERFGLDSETLAACDFVVRIPTRGTKNSLNVGIALGIAVAAWSRSEISAAAPRATEALRDARISPIGFLRGGFQNPQVAPRQGAYSEALATIELEPRFDGAPANFEQALKDLDGFERAWILFGFNGSDGWKPQVRPPRGDGSKRGLFATRAPHRPNGLGLSCVRVVNVDAEKRKIEIAEHDLLDGTPIFDIKPYIPEADAFPTAKAGWVDDIKSAAHEISERPAAKQKLDWLEAQGEKRLRDFIHEQLRFQPLDDNRKRIETSAGGHTIAFRTWRIDFRLDASMIEIFDIRSGYSEAELTDDASPDPYGDLKLHRVFSERKIS